MKKRLALLNLALLFSIVSSVVFPALHAFEHIAHDYTKHHCHHPPADGKQQITHQHSHLDHCYVCGFALSGFVTPEIYAFESLVFQRPIPYFFTPSEAPHAFAGISYLLRGPPTA
ncbi:hypothetical protein [Flavobacterium caeni]|uniref:DUF2946 domain-containing protein n=1 Tax=Flavobacterium caeni TaxID=490189 RepID=A0A1G5HA57_9FLAO|nr:hypothetical protein [Flavobacterium caeni]SCY60230.1 hypothetical protein SAMN02927903_01817 [Flavobacterium caeni]